MSKIKDLIKELCPDGVLYKEIQELCEITRGRIISKNELRQNKGDYPVYSSQTLNNGVFGNIKTYDFNGEYVQWTTDGANAGSIFYRNGKFSVTNVCGLLKVKDRNILIPKFLHYFLDSISKKYVNYSTSNPKLMNNIVSKIKIAIPPICIQEEIVNILDKFSSLEFELEAELENRIKQYEFWREKLIKNKDNKVELGSICRIVGRIGFRGYTKDDLVENQEYGAISLSPGNIKNNTLFYNDNTYVSWEKYHESPEIMIKENDIVFCKTGSTIGKVAIVRNLPHEATINPQLVILKDIKCNPLYLSHLMKSEYFQKEVSRIKGMGSIPTISQKDLSKLMIFVPTMKEQNKIAEILEKFDILINDANYSISAEIELITKEYEYYKNKLLSFEEM